MMEEHIINKTIDGELRVAKQNNVDRGDSFDSYVGMFENMREEKDYDWQSDIAIPEFTSQILTQSSLDVNTYFAQRDFVEVYMQDESDEAMAKAQAAKELINRTLNDKRLYHYQKFVRGKVINHLNGHAFAVCKWIKKKRKGIIGEKIELVPTGKDINGDDILNEGQLPGYDVKTVQVEGDVTVEDRFDYDFIDPRNVFVDDTYSYSMQQKEWIYIRTEQSLYDLKQQADEMGYTGLDEIGKPETETETSKESYNSRAQKTKTAEPVDGKYDVYDRYGKFWVVDAEDGVKPGIGQDGKPLDNAELKETIITFIVSGSTKKMIRFELNKFMGADGKPYRPIIRALCYIHPTTDGGIGDGAVVGELQTAINDTFNISNDRVRLATIPVLKATKNTVEDNTTLFIQPGHVMEEYEKDDIRELQISTDITGTVTQMSMLIQKMQQATAINPPAMGQLPALASTTATAVAGAEQHTNMRNSYKSMTFEYTFLTELYCMIQMMTYQFADADTAMKLMGEKVYNFDPYADYYYKPVSQAIESESSKAVKRKELMQMFGFAAQTGQQEPVNYLFKKYLEYLGDDFQNFGKHMFKEPMGGDQVGNAEQPTSNQYGNMQSGLEQYARYQ